MYGWNGGSSDPMRVGHSNKDGGTVHQQHEVGPRYQLLITNQKGRALGREFADGRSKDHERNACAGSRGPGCPWNRCALIARSALFPSLDDRHVAQAQTEGIWNPYRGAEDDSLPAALCV